MVAQKTREHNAALDGLRAVSFLAVYYYHCGRFPLGANGVIVFFVLSGFLIGRIFLVQRDSDVPLSQRLKTFYTRRTLRIFPLYYAVIIGLIIQSVHHGAYDLKMLWWEAAYSGNFWFVIHGPDWEGSQLFLITSPATIDTIG